ncbi:MAG: plasmid pRiA4b ORF-3 family protein, partial [Actinobacteria bacterium]|nr:plasmid pRiA4b ORF-3 family protein [Actinomycetota bacterium]
MPRLAYLDVEVSLDEISPRIWRRFLLRDRASFLDLHHAIQDACGWDNTHLFAFFGPDGDVIAGVPNDFGFGDPHPDAGKVSAGDWLKR